MSVEIFDGIGGLLICWDWALNVALWGSKTDAMWPCLHCPMVWWCMESRCCGPNGKTWFSGSPKQGTFPVAGSSPPLTPFIWNPGPGCVLCDPVAMENLYILGFLAAFTGRITEENVFAARKYKYYREMLIFSLYDDYYQRYARRLHYRALSFIMSPP